jgi:hypothetical protein
MTSHNEDQSFIHAVINPCLLEEALEWIKDNMEPADVFDEDELRSWAENKGMEDAE